MTDWDRLVTWIQALLTRGFIRVFRRSTPEGMKRVSFLDEEIVVYTYSSDSDIFAQTMLWGTIIWNNKKMEALSPLAKELVLIHESSHRDRNSVFKGVFLGFAILCAVGITSLLGVGWFILLGVPPVQLAPAVGMAAMMILGFLLMFRLDEAIADLHVVRELGEERFLKAYDEVFDTGRSTLTGWVMGKLIYTKPEHTIRFYRASKRLTSS